MTSDIFRFREFPVYIAAREFRRELKDLTKKKFPKVEDYILRQQLWRALDSIILNIAEGADKHSDKDFSHYLNNALGSVNEVIGCLDCAFDDLYISKDEHKIYLEKADNVVRQLRAFIAKVRKDNYRF